MNEKHIRVTITPAHISMASVENCHPVEVALDGMGYAASADDNDVEIDGATYTSARYRSLTRDWFELATCDPIVLDLDIRSGLY